MFRQTNFVVVIVIRLKQVMAYFPFPNGCNYATNSNEELIKHFDGIHLETNQQQSHFQKLQFSHQIQRSLPMQQFVNHNFPNHQLTTTNSNFPNRQFTTTNNNFPNQQLITTNNNFPNQQLTTTNNNFPNRQFTTTNNNFPNQNFPNQQLTTTNNNFPNQQLHLNRSDMFLSK